jgi:hypothetical protein
MSAASGGARAEQLEAMREAVHNSAVSCSTLAAHLSKARSAQRFGEFGGAAAAMAEAEALVGQLTAKIAVATAALQGATRHEGECEGPGASDLSTWTQTTVRAHSNGRPHYAPTRNG